MGQGRWSASTRLGRLEPGSGDRTRAATGLDSAFGDGIIPNIDMARVAGHRFVDAPIHYGTLGSLAEKFGRDVSAHRHSQCAQLHFVETGSLRLTLDGVTSAAPAPVLFYTPAGVPHAFVTDDDARGHVLTVDRSEIIRLSEQDQSIAGIHWQRPYCLPLSGPDGRADARELRRLFLMLRREAESDAYGRRAAMHALTNLLLVAAMRVAGGAPQHAPQLRQDQRVFRKFTDLLELHYAEQWEVGRYAEALAVTSARLTELCRRVVGQPPKQLALNRLLLEARRFLAFSTLSVNEISGALGFEDASYFSRLFRLKEGTNPLEYRENIRNPEAVMASALDSRES